MSKKACSLTVGYSIAVMSFAEDRERDSFLLIQIFNVICQCWALTNGFQRTVIIKALQLIETHQIRQIVFRIAQRYQIILKHCKRNSSKEPRFAFFFF